MKKFKVLDILAILLSIAVVVIWIIAFGQGDDASTVEIKTPDGTYVYDISKDAQYSFKGIEGISIIEIKDGKVYFVDSPCPNKTCISSAPISKAGEFIACLPNGISVRIGSLKEVDDVSF